MTNVGAGVPAFSVASNHPGQGGVPWCQPGLCELVVAKLSSEGMGVGLGAHSQCPVGVMGPKCWLG